MTSGSANLFPLMLVSFTDNCAFTKRVDIFIAYLKIFLYLFKKGKPFTGSGFTQ